MKVFKKLCLAVMLFGINGIAVQAQQTANEMAKKMTRGINLGNTFDAAGFEGAWAPATSEKDFEAYKNAGFTCVRVPITWHSGLSETDTTLRLSLEKPYKVNDVFLARLDEVLKWSLDRGLITVINVHHDEWLKSQHKFENEKERFYSLWKQLSKHYKDYPETLLFEILNEPHHETNGEKDGLTQEQLNELNAQVLQIIRKNNPTRITIYTGCGWSSLGDLKKTIVPDATDKYLMGTYHSYSPWSFAGEGIGSWGSVDDKKAMDNEFENMLAYSKENNVPIFIGEYSAQHKCEYNARMKHFAYYVENIQKYNVAATAWDDGGYLFKIYDNKTGVWDDAKDILVNYGPISPDSLVLDIADGNHVVCKWNNRTPELAKVIVERRAGRIGAFKALATVEPSETFVDESPKVNQTYYYYRVINQLKDGSSLISYPQYIYIP